MSCHLSEVHCAFKDSKLGLDGNHSLSASTLFNDVAQTDSFLLFSVPIQLLCTGLFVKPLENPALKVRSSLLFFFF